VRYGQSRPGAVTAAADEYGGWLWTRETRSSLGEVNQEESEQNKVDGMKERGDSKGKVMHNSGLHLVPAEWLAAERQKVYSLTDPSCVRLLLSAYTQAPLYQSRLS